MVLLRDNFSRNRWLRVLSRAVFYVFFFLDFVFVDIHIFIYLYLCIFFNIYLFIFIFTHTHIYIWKKSIKKKGVKFPVSAVLTEELAHWLGNPKFSCLCPDLFFFPPLERVLSFLTLFPSCRKVRSAMVSWMSKAWGCFSHKTAFVLSRVLALLGRAWIL